MTFFIDLNWARSLSLVGSIKISDTKELIFKVEEAFDSRYCPRKWLKSEGLIKAPPPEIKQGIRCMIESKIG